MQNRFKQIRKYFGLSQAEFAQKINKSPGLISCVELGRNGVSEDTINDICSVFGVDKNWLSTGEGEMFPPGSERNKADKDGIGDRVRKVRKEAGLTQKEFCKKIGYSVSQVNFVESHRSIPTNEFLRCVASALGVSFDWLLTGEGEQKAEDAVVDDKLIEWLKKNPEVVRRLRIESGLE